MGQGGGKDGSRSHTLGQRAQGWGPEGGSCRLTRCGQSVLQIFFVPWQPFSSEVTS